MNTNTLRIQCPKGITLAQAKSVLESLNFIVIEEDDFELTKEEMESFMISEKEIEQGLGISHEEEEEEEVECFVTYERENAQELNEKTTEIYIKLYNDGSLKTKCPANLKDLCNLTNSLLEHRDLIAIKSLMAKLNTIVHIFKKNI